jgi:hypothetical protein
MITTISIAHDIPPPQPKPTKRHFGEYPFRKMRVGDSFLADRYVNTTQARHRTGWNFTQRQVLVDGKVMVRCWRVA